MLKTRVVTAAVLVPALIVLVWVGGIAWYAAILAAIIISAVEFGAMAFAPQERLSKRLVVLAAALVGICLMGLGPDGPGPLYVVLGAALGAFTVHLFRPGRDLGRATARTALVVFGAIYTGALLPFAYLLRTLGPPWHGWAYVILALGLIWLGDTGAYFVGRAYGRRKLYPQVSPGKTWEGAAGGLAASVVFALIFKAAALPEVSVPHTIFLAATAGALGQVGDLCESLIKRGFGVKDSGRVMPGHGGILDRTDAVLFAGPYIYIYLRYIILS
jgi:phosphatidate cytidylyltransferase